MANFVIRFKLGVDKTKVYLCMDGNVFSTTTQLRKAMVLSSRKETIDIQKWLLTVKPNTFNKIIHKERGYTDHVSISVLSGDSEIRNKLYDYSFEDQVCS